MAKTEQAMNTRSIPSLDGLRAMSVFVVILAHTRSPLLDRIPFSASFRNGYQGVAVFFVISGFLITHLLLQELRREHHINLGRFYLRRTFRIFPPFYVYLVVIFILSRLHDVHADVRSILIAATYTWNYMKVQDTWVLGHCWSLCIEEQFYLIWPACVAIFSRRVNLGLTAGVILLSPISRVITYFAWPSMRGQTNIMLHTRLDSIMMGCLLSLIVDMGIWQRYKKFVLHPASPALAFLFLAAVDTPADHRWGKLYSPTVGFSLVNVAVAVILMYVVFKHASIPGKIMNLRLMRHFGKLSYGLYLWQQLFTGPETRFFPVDVLRIIACAEVSYLIVERPSFRIRDWALRRLSSSKVQGDREVVTVATHAGSGPIPTRTNNPY
jgi:peptidoglycan/LPS O-acetylase OafA/YrhL